LEQQQVILLVEQREALFLLAVLKTQLVHKLQVAENLMLSKIFFLVVSVLKCL
jgi:hypothetical protein